MFGKVFHVYRIENLNTKGRVHDEAVMHRQNWVIQSCELKHHLLSNAAINILQVVSMTLEEHVFNRSVGI